MFLKNKFQDPYNFILLTLLIYVGFAFFIDTPLTILQGFREILLSQDILMVDYMYVGGIGAALFNVTTVGLFSISITKLSGVPPKGIVIAAIWLMLGFAFFGKNVLNSSPILFGVYLYSLYSHKPFKDYVHIGFFSTCLSPAVTQMFYLGETSALTSLVFAILIGVLIGLLIVPLALFTARAHAGYNLYNVGFAAGIIGIFIASILRNMGFPMNTLSFWSGGNNFILTLFCLSICLTMLLFGLFNNNGYQKFSLRQYIESAKHIQDDFAHSHSFIYINMGIIGLMCTLFVLLMGGDLNGPLIGGVLTVMGFAVVGKHPLNVLPIMAGCMFVVFLNGWNLSGPGYLLTALFGTTLAPIAANFGFFWGVVAGMLHLSLAVNFSQFHGGLNLYNNGAAGGFVAILLVPTIHAIQRKDMP